MRFDGVVIRSTSLVGILIEQWIQINPLFRFSVDKIRINWTRCRHTLLDKIGARTISNYDLFGIELKYPLKNKTMKGTKS